MNGEAKGVGGSWMAVALLPLLAGAVNPTMPQTNRPNQQDEQVATPPTPGQTAGVQPRLDRAKDLIGARIVNDKGERLGTVTDDGKMMMIHVAPRSYVDRQNISFHPGDAVTITGSLTKAGRREVLVASQIQTADKTLSLRDQSGKPLWNPELSGSQRAPGSSGQRQNSDQF